MTRVVLAGTLRQYTGGEAELELEAGNVRQLFRLLGERYPKLKPHLAEGLAVAVDGQILQDAWLEPLPAGGEVFVLPQIAGG